jgi:tRNA (adenine37-N6)-methyltransferase
MKPIGYVRCQSLKTKDDYFAKEKGATVEAQAIINEELTEALNEIDTFDRVWLVWVFDRNLGDGYKTMVSPPIDSDRKHGLFVTRSPYRPNPLGLSCVKVIRRDSNSLYFEDSDILDGTPILDIKPYIPSSDCHPGSKAGWLDEVRGTHHRS